MNEIMVTNELEIRASGSSTRRPRAPLLRLDGSAGDPPGDGATARSQLPPWARESSPTGPVLKQLPPGHRAPQVRGNQPSVRRVPDENRVGLGKGDERGHRRRAGSNDVVTVIACHDHQLEITVAAIAARDPVRVHDLDATRFLARSRHESQRKDFGVSPTLTTDDGASMEPPWLQPVRSGSKSHSRENGGITPKPLPSVATGCRSQRMVRVVSMRPPSC